MSKNIAELVVKMKNETSLSVETMGDSTDQVFMAAIAVAHTVADASNGNRKKAEVVMTIAKAIIDERFECNRGSETSRRKERSLPRHPGTDRKSGGRNLAGAGHQSEPERLEADRFGRWARCGDALSGR